MAVHLNHPLALLPCSFDEFEDAIKIDFDGCGVREAHQRVTQMGQCVYVWYVRWRLEIGGKEESFDMPLYAGKAESGMHDLDTDLLSVYIHTLKTKP